MHYFTIDGVFSSNKFEYSISRPTQKGGTNKSVAY